jgi:TetR/AcrR family transcriptional repressor of nem operon
MRSSGLTVGGFYKHFRSKDDLVAESVAEGLREMRERMLSQAKQVPPRDAWREIIKNYMSLEHCENAAVGCPIAALASDMARAKPAVRRRIAAMLKDHGDKILPFVPGKSSPEKMENFVLTMTAMSGAMALARAMTDPADRERILTTVRDHLLARF